MGWFDVTLALPDSETLTIAQISDCHLVSDGGSYQGIDPACRLADVLTDVAARRVDCVVVTGDIGQEQNDAAYAILADLAREHLPECPVTWLPGNHDEPQTLYRLYSEKPFEPAKVIKAGVWHLLLLNSKGPTPAGVIEPEHFQAIQQALANVPQDAPIGIFCHHHPLPFGGFIDRHILQDGEVLLKMLRTDTRVRWFAHGHVHRARSTTLGKEESGVLQLLATPSTAIQFAEAVDGSGVNDVGPGYRLFTLNAQSFTSQVVWLNEEND